MFIEAEGKNHYVLFKDFDIFIYDHILHRRRKHFCRYCLQSFSTSEILKRHFKDCFETNGKQRIKARKKGKYVKFKNFKRKIKSTFMTHTGLESILVPEDNGKQNPEELYTNKYQKHVDCSCDYKLVCVDYKFSKPFKSYLGEDAICNFINGMIAESKYFTDITKNHFNRKLVMTKEDDEDFENSTECWICDNTHVNDVKVRDHCHITGK